MSSTPGLPFIDLRPRDDLDAVQAAIARVLARGWFVLGPEVAAFEQEFASASGARHAVGVGSGTDAITLLLRAAGIGRGDEVIIPALTAAFTGLAVVAAGARPVIVDVDPGTLTIDAGACAAAVSSRTRAIVPVHLYGQPADLDALFAVAARHALAVVEDCCQAHLATAGTVPVGTRGLGGAFSFYPTKNLAALGDGGAAITGDPAIAERVRRLRDGGQAEKYRHVEAGVNSRLDEIQAAILRERLARLPRLTERRRTLAALYRRLLAGTIAVVPERDAGHVYHLFPVRSARRDALQTHLAQHGIQTLVHYPVPLSEQPAFAPYAPPPCPTATRAGRELLSLPLYPGLADFDAERVVDAVTSFEKGHVLA